MKKALNLFLAVTTAGLVGWYLSQQDSSGSDLSNLIQKAGMPEYTGNTITTMIYDLNGKPQYFAEAKEIKRFEQTRRTEFIQPKVELFDPQREQKQWQAVANHAEMTQDQHLHLSGGVVLSSFDSQSRLQQISTERLTIDLNTHDITSGEWVTTQGMGFSTSGKGLKGNLKQQVATLLQEVKTQIDPTLVEPLKK